ncbi:hypothetical protein FB45DRAFT_551315 [Roridomyces roridus]|uniref:Uncharacterized protein n=1 Tax=Roridomyces roridus TaxID=1738132 RepID=A0AAD7FLA7_9AGAR|nr:hypothetical protein FB45DRAFT_551315 [Roridomyces roridus]
MPSASLAQSQPVTGSKADVPSGPGDAISQSPSSAPTPSSAAPSAKPSSAKPSSAQPSSAQPSSAQPSSVAAKTSSASKGAITGGAVKTSSSATPKAPSLSSVHAASASKPVASAPEAGPANLFTGTTTSTITEAPESTLSQASFIPVTDASGRTSLSLPALVTILSTSSEANGSFVTFTHVVANPTGFSQAISSGGHGFFHNSPAVAGVFVVVGAILTSIVAFGLFIFCRRRRRQRERHRRWLISVNRPRTVDGDEPEYPFQTPRTPPSPPPMRDAHMGDTHNWGIPVRSSLTGSAGLGLYDIPPVRRVQPPQELEQTYPRNSQGPIGLAITTDHSGRSSPSIYPPTLPAENNEDPFSDAEEVSPDMPMPPPRPRRSHLRDQGQLITPPSSVSGHSPVAESPGLFGLPLENEPRMPPMQLNELMGRRTLLDVRRSG